jgi:hypothetical protein
MGDAAGPGHPAAAHDPSPHRTKEEDLTATDNLRVLRQNLRQARAHVAASVMGRANLNANQGRLGRVQRLMLSVNRTIWPRQDEAGTPAERDSLRH